MGSNRRYADQIDRRVDARTDEVIMRDRAPVSLTSRELQLDVDPVTITPVPIAARAWVRYDTIALQLNVRVLRWTPRAVGIEWDTPAGVHRAWVWASAVERTGGESR